MSLIHRRLSRLTVPLMQLTGVLALSTLQHAVASAPADQPAAERSYSSKTRVAGNTAIAPWIDAEPFIDRMVVQHQFDRGQLRALLSRIRLVERAVQLVKPAPPGRPKNWQAYRDRFVEPVRIQAGVDFWDRYADELARAEQRFGVPAEIIVGIIGVETTYGRNTGNFRVIDALATLAFAYPETHNREARMDYFRRELENLLLYARDSNIDPFSLLGSYAGAIGWPQFMPGSIRRYAIDFDGDRQIDLRDSPVDAIGSVANFLVEHGWTSGLPTAFPTRVAENGNWTSFLDQGLQANYQLDHLVANGVQPVIPSTPADLRYGLVYLQNGEDPTEYWLATNNFYAITKYNRSYFYAMSVIELGKSVRVARSR